MFTSPPSHLSATARAQCLNLPCFRQQASTESVLPLPSIAIIALDVSDMHTKRRGLV